MQRRDERAARRRARRHQRAPGARRVTPLQREVLQSSPLDELLLGAAARRARARARRWRPARSRRSRPSCRAAARASCCRPPTSRPTAPARCATSSRASCGSRASRRSTSASGSSSTRCSSASTGPAAAAPRRCCALLDAGWRRGGFSDSDEERQLREKARVALLRYHERLGAERRRAALVRALVLLPARAPPHPRPRRPRRRARRRRLRADRLQDRAAASAPSSCATTSSSRSTRSRRARPGRSRRPSAPTTTCSTTRACGSALDDGARGLDRGHRRARSRAAILAQGFEPTPSLRGLLDVRVPDRLSGRREVARGACTLAGDGACAVAAGRRMRRPAGLLRRCPPRAGAGSAGTRARGGRPRDVLRLVALLVGAICSRRSTKACTSGSLWTASADLALVVGGRGLELAARRRTTPTRPSSLRTSASAAFGLGAAAT